MAAAANCAPSVIPLNAMVDELLAVNWDRHSVEPAGPQLAVEAGDGICVGIGKPVEARAAVIRSASGSVIRPGSSWQGPSPD